MKRISTHWIFVQAFLIAFTTGVAAHSLHMPGVIHTALQENPYEVSTGQDQSVNRETIVPAAGAPGVAELSEIEETLTISFKQMLAHIGQTFTLYVKELSSGEALDTVVIESVAEQDFVIQSSVIEVGGDYQIDFWADLNKNGMYDTPPTDHAWRLILEDVEGDTTIEFVHNGSFTDIMAGSSAIYGDGQDLHSVDIYPNPADTHIIIESGSRIEGYQIFSSSGRLMESVDELGMKSLLISTAQLSAGSYVIRLELMDQSGPVTTRFIRK